jgi:hypothetical protein
MFNKPRFWILLIALVTMGIYFMIREPSDPTTATAPSSERAVSPAPVAAQSQAEMTLEKFNRIKNGMTREEVEQITGMPGEVTSNTGSGETAQMNIIYKHPDSLAYAAVIFKGGKVMGKLQREMR